MQLFNEINSRKILDEYNIFAGIHHSPIFLCVLGLTAVLQVIIVQTPVSNIFHVHPLNGARPPFLPPCVLIPAGTAAALPVSLPGFSQGERHISGSVRFQLTDATAAGQPCARGYEPQVQTGQSDWCP